MPQARMELRLDQQHRGHADEVNRVRAAPRAGARRLRGRRVRQESAHAAAVTDPPAGSTSCRPWPYAAQPWRPRPSPRSSCAAGMSGRAPLLATDGEVLHRGSWPRWLGPPPMVAAAGEAPPWCITGGEAHLRSSQPPSAMTRPITSHSTQRDDTAGESPDGAITAISVASTRPPCAAAVAQQGVRVAAAPLHQCPSCWTGGDGRPG